jgi:hypothetical protein
MSIETERIINQALRDRAAGKDVTGILIIGYRVADSWEMQQAARDEERKKQ